MPGIKVDMISPIKFTVLAMAVAVCLAIASCASKPVLLPKSAVVPANVDFSGRWKLRAGPGSELPGIAPRDPGIRIPPADSSRNSNRRAPRRQSNGAVHVFLENGELLKISQTPAGLFISFDRAIVEEYTFGENRAVSVGPIEAQRVSGWQGDSFIVQTLDGEGSILTETWRLVEDGRTLLRSISVTRGETKKLSAEQRFEKI